VSHLVTQGGFPQFLLPPVNFEALYARSLSETQSPTQQNPTQQ
jgi:preprotein translocase subunit SecB